MILKSYNTMHFKRIAKVRSSILRKSHIVASFECKIDLHHNKLVNEQPTPIILLCGEGLKMEWYILFLPYILE